MSVDHTTHVGTGQNRPATPRDNHPVEEYTDEELRRAWRELRAELERWREAARPDVTILLALFEAEIVRRFLAQS